MNENSITYQSEHGMIYIDFWTDSLRHREITFQDLDEIIGVNRSVFFKDSEIEDVDWMKEGF